MQMFEYHRISDSKKILEFFLGNYPETENVVNRSFQVKSLLWAGKKKIQN